MFMHKAGTGMPKAPNLVTIQQQQQPQKKNDETLATEGGSNHRVVSGQRIHSEQATPPLPPPPSLFSPPSLPPFIRFPIYWGPSNSPLVRKQYNVDGTGEIHHNSTHVSATQPTLTLPVNRLLSRSPGETHPQYTLFCRKDIRLQFLREPNISLTFQPSLFGPVAWSPTC